MQDDAAAKRCLSVWFFGIYFAETTKVLFKKVQEMLLWRYMYDKIQFTELAIQLVESDIQQVKFDKKKATKGEKH